MSDYHVFLLNDAGRIFCRTDLQCWTDEEALEIATVIEAPSDIEVWCGSRMVWTGKPHPKILVDEKRESA
jgi:hypothetical protein